jgi:hypothetical protein
MLRFIGKFFDQSLDAEVIKMVTPALVCKNDIS